MSGTVTTRSVLCLSVPSNLSTSKWNPIGGVSSWNSSRLLLLVFEVQQSTAISCHPPILRDLIYSQVRSDYKEKLESAAYLPSKLMS